LKKGGGKKNRRKERTADNVNNWWHGVFCTTQWMQDTQHPTWRIEIGEAFQWRSGGWEAEACTPPGVLVLRHFWGCV